MPSYQISFDDFLREIKLWKLNKDMLYKVKMQEFEDYLQFSFSLPNTSDEYVATILKEDFSDVQRMELAPITINAVRISEQMTAARMLAKKLEDLKLTGLLTQKIEEK